MNTKIYVKNFKIKKKKSLGEKLFKSHEILSPITITKAFSHNFVSLTHLFPHFQAK